MYRRRGYRLRKLLLDAGISFTAPDDVFRGRARPLEPEGVPLRDERMRLSPSLAWYSASLLFASGGALAVSAGLIDRIPGVFVPPETQNLRVVLSGVAAILIAGALAAFGRAGLPPLPWFHGVLVVGIALVTFGVWATGTIATSLIAFYVMPMMGAAFFLPARQGITYIIACITLVSLVGLSLGQGRQATLDIVYGGMFLTIVSGALMFARRRLQASLLHNVELAGRDPLTGAANLRRFNDALQDEVRRSQRHGMSVTVFMIDLDDFKLVNDLHSHTLGDAVLVACARAMQDEVRADELLARRGGDEFAVITVHDSHDEPNALAERLRTAIRRQRTALCPDVSTEGSVGFATWRVGERPDELLRRADDALHVSKLLAHATEPYSET